MQWNCESSDRPWFAGRGTLYDRQTGVEGVDIISACSSSKGLITSTHMCPLSWHPTVGNTVRLRFSKSISGHHFQTIGQLANNDFQYHREGFYDIQQYILTKKSIFLHVRNFTMIYGPFTCVTNVHFNPIFRGNLSFFSNARLIFELMLCNRNLTKLDILTLFSSDCSACAQKIREHLKKWQN